MIFNIHNCSVDSKTDEIMQRMIREKFSNHMVLAVAHKLDTILDFDKVAMLEAGKLIEFDDPYTLLSTDSAFNKLYTSTVANEIENEQKYGSMDNIILLSASTTASSSERNSTGLSSDR
jgi:ABC-type transport system involved in cytochrome bd biosynthesis fused ATPase/permease subunit